MIVILFTVLINIQLYSQTEKDVDDVHGLMIGEKAPIFQAINADSVNFSLEKALKEGPVVLIFYRGHWCPVCNQHLGILQDSLKFIKEKGAMVIAVSPEKPEFLDEMADNTGAKFNLLYDEGYRIANAYDVTFKPTSFALFKYNTFTGANLKKAHSDDSQQLPIPATYIIDQSGIIIWRQFDPNYKSRSSVKDILEALNDI